MNHIFYFTHPGRSKHTEVSIDDNGNIPYSERRSSIQVARLNIENEQLVVEPRDEGVQINLKPILTDKHISKK